MCTYLSSVVFLQGDNLPEIPAQTVTEEKYTDEHGNMVVKKVRNAKMQRCKVTNKYSFKLL